MKEKPKEKETPEEALDWLLKEKEGKGIKILNPKTEREEREKAKKLFKKKIGEFGQQELFKDK